MPHGVALTSRTYMGSVVVPWTMTLVQDIGHLLLQVGDMGEALRFYRDTLGFGVPGKVDPVWTVVTTKGAAITLFARKEPVPCALRDGWSPFEFHVANFEEAANTLERAGYTVQRKGVNLGLVQDPWGNVLRLHDHREDG